MASTANARHAGPGRVAQAARTARLAVSPAVAAEAVARDAHPAHRARVGGAAHLSVPAAVPAEALAGNAHPARRARVALAAYPPVPAAVAADGAGVAHAPRRTHRSCAAGLPVAAAGATDVVGIADPPGRARRTVAAHRSIRSAGRAHVGGRGATERGAAEPRSAAHLPVRSAGATGSVEPTRAADAGVSGATHLAVVAARLARAGIASKPRVARCRGATRLSVAAAGLAEAVPTADEVGIAGTVAAARPTIEPALHADHGIADRPDLAGIGVTACLTLRSAVEPHLAHPHDADLHPRARRAARARGTLAHPSDAGLGRIAQGTALPQRALAHSADARLGPTARRTALAGRALARTIDTHAAIGASRRAAGARVATRVHRRVTPRSRPFDEAPRSEERDTCDRSEAFHPQTVSHGEGRASTNANVVSSCAGMGIGPLSGCTAMRRSCIVATLLLTVGCGDVTLRGDGGTGDAGGSGATCDPASPMCPAGEYCSAARICLPMGECRVDADCGGRVCGAGSRTCLSPGECGADGDCPAGQVCNGDTSVCEIGGMCGMTEFAITRLAPNVMILLDRSGSMDNDVDGRTRWDVAKQAVRTVTERFGAEIRFGLATYSSCTGSGCSAGSVVVPIGDDVSRINDFLAPLAGRGSRNGAPPDYLCDSGDPETSTGPSLMALTTEPTLQDADRANAVLLVTDGQESDCGGPDGAGGATALRALPIPVRTYAVGFSADVSGAQLMAVAVAGGTERYYPANDEAGLAAAFEMIADEVATCDYRIDMPPPDPMDLFVYFNDDPAGIASDATDGYTFDVASGTLRFNGAACAQIRGGMVMDIDVVFGCPGPILE